MLGAAISFNIGTVSNRTAPVTKPVSHYKGKTMLSLPQMLTVPHIVLLHRLSTTKHVWCGLFNLSPLK